MVLRPVHNLVVRVDMALRRLCVEKRAFGHGLAQLLFLVVAKPKTAWLLGVVEVRHHRVQEALPFLEVVLSVPRVAESLLCLERHIFTLDRAFVQPSVTQLSSNRKKRLLAALQERV